MAGIAILGAGMAGLGAAHRCRELGLEAVVYEMRRRPGGHTRAFFNERGFIFDAKDAPGTIHYEEYW